MPFLIEENIEDTPGISKSFEIQEPGEKKKESRNQMIKRIMGEYGKPLETTAREAIKGSIEGLYRFGRMMGPLKTKESERELQEKTSERLEELIPSETEKTFIDKSLRRGLQQLPSVSASPFPQKQIVQRAIGAGFLGEGAKSLGLPGWVQTAAELTAYIGPDLTEKLILQGKNKDIISFGKQMGLNDEQITPLLQSETKQKWLGKLAQRRGRSEKVLKYTKKALGETYDFIRDNPIAKTELSEIGQTNFVNSLEKILTDNFSVEQRTKIIPEISDLLRNPITGDSLISFYKKLNSYYKTNPEFGIIKGPIQEALNEINPALSKNFEGINNLFSKYYEIAGNLKPGLISDMVSAGEALGLLGSIVTGNYEYLGKILASEGIRTGATELLLNPRLNQLGEKFLLAINNNKFALAAKTYELFNKEVKKIDSNIETRQYTENDIKEILGQ